MTRESTAKANVLGGIGIGRGCAVGRLFFLSRRPHSSSTQKVLSPFEEQKKLNRALESAEREALSLYHSAKARLGEEEASIFHIHAMMLQDEDLLDFCKRGIARGLSAREAVEAAEAEYRKVLSALNDGYLSSRTADLHDITQRVIGHLEGGYTPIPLPDHPHILVADDLTPSETLNLPKDHILGFVTLEGSPTSHTAILARALGIPALVGIGSILGEYDGKTAILDAPGNCLLLSPDDETLALFNSRMAEQQTAASRPKEAYPALTKRQKRILIYANIGSEAEAEAAQKEGAEGVGLLRSEFLYLSHRRYPTEEELYRSYTAMAEHLPGKRMIIRTLDIGADKRIPYLELPEEVNPALGLRGIRVSLSREELFKVQLRAILRASALSRIALMLPMVVSTREVMRCRELLEACMDELKEKGQRYDPHIEFGIMIETPAAVMMSVELAQTVDFFSVGTNDLTQYTLAADRQNPALATLIETGKEPVLRMIRRAAQAIHEKGGWIGVCGEMASDLRLTQRFADMGIDELSVSVPYIDEVRRQVCECD